MGAATDEVVAPHMIAMLGPQLRGIPEHIRSDNGSEFVAKQLRSWLAGVGVQTLYIEPGRVVLQLPMG